MCLAWARKILLRLELILCWSMLQLAFVMIIVVVTNIPTWPTLPSVLQYYDAFLLWHGNDWYWPSFHTGWIPMTWVQTPSSWAKPSESSHFRPTPKHTKTKSFLNPTWTSPSNPKKQGTHPTSPQPPHHLFWAPQAFGLAVSEGELLFETQLFELLAELNRSLMGPVAWSVRLEGCSFGKAGQMESNG